MKASSHRISIPSILEVGAGNINKIGKLLKREGFSNVVVISDEIIFKIYGEEITNSIKIEGINILENTTEVSSDFEKIAESAFSIKNECDAIIGIGGGKVLDIAKYMSFLRKIPFISIPTSTSNDGFSSSVASLLLNGKRTSVPAKIAYGVIVDINIIKSSPEKFIYSGIGDLMSNITAIQDWKFEEQNNKTVVDDFATMMSKKAVSSFVRTEFTTIKDDFFVKELVDSLTMNGIAMEIAGNSSPASGAEHLISHALDKFLEKPELHGIQVGIATYIMSKVQNHRFQRITKVFTDTGFFEYVKTLKMKKEDYINAIDMAPSIKPQRYTYIHVEEYREVAKKIVMEDEILNSILI